MKNKSRLMEKWLISITGGFILSLLHIIGPRIKKFVRGLHIEITSLSAGMFLSYIFLEGLTHIAEAHVVLGRTILLSLFLGFSLYHILSKYLYQHVKHKEDIKAERSRLMYIGAMIDSVFAGFALVVIFQLKDVSYFAILPFMLHIFSATLAFQTHHEYFKISGISKSISSFSPLIGVLIGEAVLLEIGAFYHLLAFVIGAVLYIAVRHMLPRGGKGDLKYFIIGAGTGIILLLF